MAIGTALGTMVGGTRPKPLMLVDPPEVRQYAARGDQPVSRWPGHPVTRKEIMAAAGDPRDWFRYGHRQAAAEESWAEFIDGRRRRRDLMAGFGWNQILILGDYGSGKTTLATHFARHFFGRGHAVFANASCLFGWRLEAEEMYTAMGFVPKASILMIDESSAALASRVGHGVAVSSFIEMNLNSRKQNCIVIYMSAQDWQIAAAVRRDCKEVWMPVIDDDLSVQDGEEGGGTNQRRKPHDDVSNFRLAWHVWDDFPYRKANLIEGPDTSGEGFGAPSYSMFDEGENVRRAFLLNDTFELAAAGAGTLADRETVKANLMAFHGRGDPAGAQVDEKRGQVERLLAFIESESHDPPEYWRAGDFARAMGVSAQKAGMVMSELMGVPPVRNKGYRAETIFEYLSTLAPEG